MPPANADWKPSRCPRAGLHGLPTIAQILLSQQCPPFCPPSRQFLSIALTVGWVHLDRQGIAVASPEGGGVQVTRARASIHRESPAGDSGAAIVEFALLLTALLLIVMGIINFGYLFGQKLSLNQAVREGARMAVVPGQDNGASVNSTPEIELLVQNSTGGLVNEGDVDVAVMDVDGNEIDGGCGTVGLDVGDQIKVVATYDTSGIVYMPLPVLPSTITLTSTAVFRCEWT